MYISNIISFCSPPYSVYSSHSDLRSISWPYEDLPLSAWGLLYFLLEIVFAPFFTNAKPQLKCHMFRELFLYHSISITFPVSSYCITDNLPIRTTDLFAYLFVLLSISPEEVSFLRAGNMLWLWLLYSPSLHQCQHNHYFLKKLMNLCYSFQFSLFWEQVNSVKPL